MIVKLSFLDSHGHTKNKIFRKEHGQGIQPLRKMLEKYDRWDSCDFVIYYIEEKGKHVLLNDDQHLENYLLLNPKNARIWAKEAEKLDEEEKDFQILGLSEIQLNDVSKLSELSLNICPQSRIFIRNQLPPQVETYIKQKRDIDHCKEIDEKQIFFHAVIKQRVHLGVHCAVCQQQDIQGVRYQCLICYSFNLCQRCQSDEKNEHQHPVLKIKQPRKEFTQKNFQQLRDNIDNLLPSPKRETEKQEKLLYLQKIEELQSNYLSLLREYEKSTQVSKKNQATQVIQSVVQKTNNLKNAVAQSIDSSRQVIGKLGKKMEETVFNIKKIVRLPQKKQKMKDNTLKNLQDSNKKQEGEEIELFQRANFISEKVGRNFEDVLNFLHQFSHLQNGDIIELMRN